MTSEASDRSFAYTILQHIKYASCKFQHAVSFPTHVYGVWTEMKESRLRGRAHHGQTVDWQQPVRHLQALPQLDAGQSLAFSPRESYKTNHPSRPLHDLCTVDCGDPHSSQSCNRSVRRREHSLSLYASPLHSSTSPRALCVFFVPCFHRVPEI